METGPLICHDIFAFFVNQSGGLTLAAHVSFSATVARIFRIAAIASRRWSAPFVYRTTSLRLAWPVIAAISC